MASRRASRALRFAPTLLSLSLLAAIRPAAAQDLTQTVEAETFFADEPAWLFGLRASLGYDLDLEELYPALGATLGYVGANHLYLGGAVDVRLTEIHYVRVGFRIGVLFTGTDIAWGIGVSPAFMAFPQTSEYGFLLTWGTMGRVRLSGPHYLTAHLEVDMLFDLLGFHRTRAFLTGGLGWAVTF